MTIEKILDGAELTVKVAGRIDTTTAPDLEKELKESLDGITSLILNFDELAYISSAGLRVLLSAQKIMKKQGSMVVVGASEGIREIFEVTGFFELLNIR